jgi:hypothetical protein
LPRIYGLYAYGAFRLRGAAMSILLAGRCNGWSTEPCQVHQRVRACRQIDIPGVLVLDAAMFVRANLTYVCHLQTDHL